MTPSRTELARTDTESIVRTTAFELICAVSAIEQRWAIAAPPERGQMWLRMQRARENAQRAYETVPDPKPGQCAKVWFDALDNLWDRCGLPVHHQVEHQAEYMVKHAQAQGGDDSHG